MSKNETELIKIPEEDIEVLPISPVRSAKFTSESFTDRDVMVYEKNNAFALSYYGMSRIEQSLLCAGLVIAYNENKKEPFSKYAIEQGLQLSASIQDVAKIMGYEVGEGNKSFYKTIKQAALRLSKNNTFLRENATQTGFSIYNLISQIDYNKDNDGCIKYVFSPGASENFLNNNDNFTPYSMILRNQVDTNGKNTAVRLLEVLKTDLYRAKKKPFQRYYDYVDIRAKLDLIDVHNPVFIKILENKRYSLKNVLDDSELALERLKMVEDIDSITRENITRLKNSEEYKNIIKYRKSAEFKALKTRLKELQGTPEYEVLYREKMMPVIEMENKMQHLLHSIVVQYSDWSDFKKRVLIPAQKAFLQVYKDADLMDLMFEYKPVYYKSKVIGVIFTIYTVEDYKKKELENGVQISIFDYINEKESVTSNSTATAALLETKTDSVNVISEQMKKEMKKKTTAKKIKKEENLETTVELFENYIKQYPSKERIELSALEIMKLSKLADFEVLRDKYSLMLQQTYVNSPIAWMTTAVKENYSSPVASSAVKKKKDGYNSKDQFNQFIRNDYEPEFFKELENNILANNLD